MIGYLLSQPGNEQILSINPVVGKTNDGWLNDIRGRHISVEDVVVAITGAKGGPVEEGAVGAGISDPAALCTTSGSSECTPERMPP